MSIGLYVGSFDPITVGHLDIIKRSMAFCKQLFVVVGVNPVKKTLFTAEERVKLISQVIDAEFDFLTAVNISVVEHTGLIATYAEKLGVNVFIRGVRSVADFEYETNWSLINKELMPSIETVFIPTNPNLSIVSSSAVKELASLGVPLDKFAHPIVSAALIKKNIRS